MRHKDFDPKFLNSDSFAIIKLSFLVVDIVYDENGDLMNIRRKKSIGAGFIFKDLRNFWDLERCILYLTVDYIGKFISKTSI